MKLDQIKQFYFLICDAEDPLMEFLGTELHEHLPRINKNIFVNGFNQCHLMILNI